MSEEQQGCNHDCEHCSSKTETCEADLRFAEEQKLIKHKIVVLSGKGGVGKSTMAVNLAYGLAARGFKVGLVDVDLHGPSIPTMLGIKDSTVYARDERLLPVECEGIDVMSVEFFLPDKDAAVVWRGPMKYGAIKQFLQETYWGELDYLVVDCPPGTGDEPLGVCQMLQGEKHALVVTTPQEVSAADVRKSLDFCRLLPLPVLGVVENMSGFVCPHCGEVTYIFKQGGGEKLAEKANVPFLAKIPIEPGVGTASDEGKPFMKAIPDSAAAKAFAAVVDAAAKL